MACPKCGSQEWKLASLVHTEGISTISATTIGIGTGADTSSDSIGVGVGVGSTRGKQQSELSKLAAPPIKGVRPAKSFATLGFIILVIGIVFFSHISFSSHPISTSILFVIAPLMMLVGVLRLLLTPDIANELDKKNIQAILDYDKKRMCLRCGTFYIENKKQDDSKPNIPAAIETKQTKCATKKCPYCAEEILAEAIICKHCHSKIQN